MSFSLFLNASAVVSGASSFLLPPDGAVSLTLSRYEVVCRSVSGCQNEFAFQAATALRAGGKRGIRTRGGVSLAGLANRYIQPL